MLGLAAARQRASVLADERLGDAAGSVFAGVRDVTACGTEDTAAALVARPIAEQAAAERALAGVAALRTACFAVGGWLPLLVLLFAGPWLVSQRAHRGRDHGRRHVRPFRTPARAAELRRRGRRQRAAVRDHARPGARREHVCGRSRTMAHPPADGHAVTLRDVTFAYGPHAEPVVRHLDLTVAEGEHLAVVGPSGIGKSTVVSLVCGLLRPDDGEVELGGVRAADLSPAELATIRVLIPQEAYVFAGTLRENLTYLCADATTADLDAAVAALGADLGDYDAVLRPQEMSAGERQLVALVRAYLSPAPLVVLDEATCHLDPAAERRAEQAFAARPGTLVVIAHRISSALRADRILVLDSAGAAIGDHATLLRTSPLYRDLLGHWEAGRTPASQPA